MLAVQYLYVWCLKSESMSLAYVLNFGSKDQKNVQVSSKLDCYWIEPLLNFHSLIGKNLGALCLFWCVVTSTNIYCLVPIYIYIYLYIRRVLNY